MPYLDSALFLRYVEWEMRLSINVKRRDMIVESRGG
jgi:hypothetical protein